MKDWISVVSAFLGFLAGISGTWLTQRATRRLEKDRWDREQVKAGDNERKQLYIDLAEYFEDRLDWVRNIDFAVEEYEPAKLGLHRNQLAGRVKMSAPRSVVTGWEHFRYHLENVLYTIKVGNIHQSKDPIQNTEFDDQTQIPDAVIAGEIAILTIRAEIEGRALPDLVQDLRDVLLPNDPRYPAALDKFLENTMNVDSLWWDVFSAHNSKMISSEH